MTRSRQLRQASIHVVSGQSLVVPLIIEGLPPAIDALGTRWQRKREFHLTAVAARVVEEAGHDVEGVWERVSEVASNRWLGPISVGTEIRRVVHSEKPDLQTLIVMADCPALDELYADLSKALSRQLTPPPAHVTLYSTDPAAGIGITNQAELDERAPSLSEPEQEEIRRATGFP